MLGKFKTDIVAITHPSGRDGIAEMIAYELDALGYQTVYFQIGDPIPENASVVLSFGPYGRFLTVPRQLAKISPSQRPIFVHWNTEGIPDPRIPWSVMSLIAKCRSWMGGGQETDNGAARYPISKRLSSVLEYRMLRFRHIGDYYYAHRRGWLDIFADTSQIYADFHRQHGLPTVVAHWGATPIWYNDLGLERDIDVLWMGIRGTARRSRILDRVRRDLERYGVRMHVADGNENPFIFDEERIQYLNRSKIILNITRTWYDDNFSRFALAAPNRLLIVSEPVLPHCPIFQPGVHYVSVPERVMAKKILYYLEHEDERLQIIDNAYHLLTKEHPIRESFKTIMDAANLVHKVDPSNLQFALG